MRQAPVRYRRGSRFVSIDSDGGHRCVEHRLVTGGVQVLGQREQRPVDDVHVALAESIRGAVHSSAVPSRPSGIVSANSRPSRYALVRHCPARLAPSAKSRASEPSASFSRLDSASLCREASLLTDEHPQALGLAHPEAPAADRQHRLRARVAAGELRGERAAHPGGRGYGAVLRPGPHGRPRDVPVRAQDGALLRGRDDVAPVGPPVGVAFDALGCSVPSVATAGPARARGATSPRARPPAQRAVR